MMFFLPALAQQNAGVGPGVSMEMPGNLGMIRAPRIESSRIYSSPPPLMDRQMGLVETLNVPPLGYELDGSVKVFTLIAQPMTRVLTDGHPTNAAIVPEMKQLYGEMMSMMTHTTQNALVWGYNGSMPGPTLELTEGDTIRVIFKNELPEPSSIHWHGLEVPNEQDGAGGTTEPPTPPLEGHISMSSRSINMAPSCITPASMS